MSYQKCPVCEGLGQFIDLTQPLANFSNPVTCPTCKGTRIISTLTGLPPVKKGSSKIHIESRGHFGITEEDLKRMHIIEYKPNE